MGHYIQKVTNLDYKKNIKKLDIIIEKLTALKEVLSLSSGEDIEEAFRDIENSLAYFNNLRNSTEEMINVISTNAKTFDRWCLKYPVNGKLFHKYDNGMGGFVNSNETITSLEYSGDSGNDLAYINTTLVDKITNYTEKEVTTITYNCKRVIDEMSTFSNVLPDGIITVGKRINSIADTVRGTSMNENLTDSEAMKKYVEDAQKEHRLLGQDGRGSSMIQKENTNLNSFE